MKQKRAVKPTWKAEEKIGFWLSQKEKYMFRFFGKLGANEDMGISKQGISLTPVGSHESDPFVEPSYEPERAELDSITLKTIKLVLNNDELTDAKKINIIKTLVT